MNRNKIVWTIMVLLLAVVPGSVSASGSEINLNIPTLGKDFFTQDVNSIKTVWLNDPETGAQIGYVLKDGFADAQVTSAKWTGPVADGKADGKGSIVISLKREIAAKKTPEISQEQQTIEYTIQGEAEMAAGLLQGTASLDMLIKNTRLSQAENKAHAMRFEGFFVAGVEEGYGKLTWNDKILFDGQWKAGWKDNGYLLKTGGQAWRFTYEGEIKEGKANGYGKVTVRNFGSYQGEFKDGKYEGQGVFRYQSFQRGGLSRPDEVAGGASYKGMFSNDQPNGYGVYKDSRGQIVYEGEWKDGKPINQ